MQPKQNLSRLLWRPTFRCRVTRWESASTHFRGISSCLIFQALGKCVHGGFIPCKGVKSLNNNNKIKLVFSTELKWSELHTVLPGEGETETRSSLRTRRILCGEDQPDRTPSQPRVSAAAAGHADSTRTCTARADSQDGDLGVVRGRPAARAGRETACLQGQLTLWMQMQA